MDSTREFSSDERRKFMRHSVRQPVMLACPAGAFRALNGITVNVSTGGVLLTLEARIAVGSSVELFLEIPAPSGTGSYPARCLGTVVRVEPYKDDHAIAIAFASVEQIGTA